jgi:hypothetical protein
MYFFINILCLIYISIYNIFKNKNEIKIKNVINKFCGIKNIIQPNQTRVNTSLFTVEHLFSIKYIFACK